MISLYYRQDGIHLLQFYFSSTFTLIPCMSRLYRQERRVQVV